MESTKSTPAAAATEGEARVEVEALTGDVVQFSMPAAVFARVPAWSDAPSHSDVLEVMGLSPEDVDMVIKFATKDLENPIVLENMQQPLFLDAADIHAKYRPQIEEARKGQETAADAEGDAGVAEGGGDDVVDYTQCLSLLEQKRDEEIAQLEPMPRPLNTTDVHEFGFPKWAADMVDDMGVPQLIAMANAASSVGYTEMMYLACAGLARVYATMPEDLYALITRGVEEECKAEGVDQDDYDKECMKDSKWAHH